MGIRAASPTPLELPLSNRTWFSVRAAGARQLCGNSAADARRAAEVKGLSSRVRRLRRACPRVGRLEGADQSKSPSVLLLFKNLNCSPHLKALESRPREERCSSGRLTYPALALRARSKQGRHAMTIQVGDRLPQATFRVMTADGPAA